MTENPFDQNSNVAVEDLDVDTPELDEAEDTVEAPAAETKDKPAKEKKESSRPPVPSGYTTPVQFAKKLTEHLHTNGKLDADKEIPPQVVYSYIKNSKSGKNPFPVYDGVEGRNNLLKLDDAGNPQEALDWWDAKDARVAESKQNAAAKAAKKAAKAEATDKTEEPTGPVEEAE